MFKLRRMRWVGHVTCMGKIRNKYKILVRKSKGKRQLRRPRCWWEDNKIYVRDNGMMMWNGFICLRIGGASGRLLLTQSWTFRSHKRRGISWHPEWLLKKDSATWSFFIQMVNGFKKVNQLHQLCQQLKKSNQILKSKLFLLHFVV
jgi:hypothetical protein